MDAKANQLLAEVGALQSTLQTMTSLAVAAESAVETWKGRCESTQRLLDDADAVHQRCAAELGRVLATQLEQQQQLLLQKQSSPSSTILPHQPPPLPLPTLVQTLAASKETAEEQLIATRALLSAQLTSLEVAELAQASKEVNATCSERFESVAIAVASLDATSQSKSSEQVGLLQQEMAKSIVDADALGTLHRTALATVATLTKQVEGTSTKLAESFASSEKLKETLGSIQSERARLSQTLKESKQLAETQKLRLVDMSQRVLSSEKECAQLRTEKQQCEKVGAAARFQLNTLTIELEETQNANDDFEREAARANKLGEQAKRLKRTLEAQEIKLAATTQRLGHERGRRLDAEAMLDDSGSAAAAASAVSSLPKGRPRSSASSGKTADRSARGGGRGNVGPSSALPTFPRA